MEDIFLISARRQEDAIISIEHYKNGQRLVITKTNKAAEKLLGISKTEIPSLKVQNIFSDSICGTINEYMEFSISMYSLGHILSRHSKPFVKFKNKDQIPVKIKPFITNHSENVIRYEILMRKITEVDKMYELYKYTNGLTLDAKHNILDIKSMQKAMSLVFEFSEKNNLHSTMCYVDFLQPEVDNEHSSILKKTIRQTDIIGLFNSQSIGIILLGCTKEDIPSVSSRFSSEIISECTISYDSLWRDNFKTSLIKDKSEYKNQITT